MKTTSIFGSLLGTVVALFISVPAFAGFWDMTTPYKGPYRDVVNLVVISNYAQPRLLADLIQTSNRQPYLLFPAKEGGAYYFIPARGDALEIREDRIRRFIDFLNPRQIIVLGDRRYISDQKMKLVDPKRPIIRFWCADWDKTAIAVGKFLDLPNLAGDFKELNAQIQHGNLYAPDHSVDAMSPLSEADFFEPIVVSRETVVVETDPATGRTDAPKFGTHEAPLADPVIIDEK
jgi:hypothetical protein